MPRGWGGVTWFFPTISSKSPREFNVTAAGPDFLFNQVTIVSAVLPPKQVYTVGYRKLQEIPLNCGIEKQLIDFR